MNPKPREQTVEFVGLGLAGRMYLPLGTPKAR